MGFVVWVTVIAYLAWRLFHVELPKDQDSPADVAAVNQQTDAGHDGNSDDGDGVIRYEDINEMLVVGDIFNADGSRKVAVCYPTIWGLEAERFHRGREPVLLSWDEVEISYPISTDASGAESPQLCVTPWKSSKPFLWPFLAAQSPDDDGFVPRSMVGIWPFRANLSPLDLNVAPLKMAGFLHREVLKGTLALYFREIDKCLVDVKVFDRGPARGWCYFLAVRQDPAGLVLPKDLLRG